MNRLDQCLRPGERIVNTESFSEISINHFIHAVADEEGNEGYTVLLEMEQHGNAVGAVEIVGDIELTVRAVSGTGLLVMHDGESGEISAIVLDAGSDIDDTEAVKLKRGDSYAYLNVGKGPFVVRDDCYPAFDESAEELATNSDLLAALGQLGIVEYQ